MSINKTSHTPPPFIKRSRAKIWIRSIVLAIFSVIFILALYKDIQAGFFTLIDALLIFGPFTLVGYSMRKLVPMHVHQETQHITFSFDRIYFALIVLLVIAKVFTGHVPELTFWTDVIMCVILGLMSGRLSGICLRVRGLKEKHFQLKK